MSLTDMTVKAEEAAAAAALAAQHLPAKLEARVREVEHELGRTIQLSSDYHKQVVKGDRRVKELQFQVDEDNKNKVREIIRSNYLFWEKIISFCCLQERIAELVDKLQQKIKSYKKQIEEAEEIAAINLAKYRKAQQELEEAEERSRAAEQNIEKYRGIRGGSVGY